jgi:hypothetical protein
MKLESSFTAAMASADSALTEFCQALFNFNDFLVD